MKKVILLFAVLLSVLSVPLPALAWGNGGDIQYWSRLSGSGFTTSTGETHTGYGTAYSKGTADGGNCVYVLYPTETTIHVALRSRKNTDADDTASNDWYSKDLSGNNQNLSENLVLDKYGTIPSSPHDVQFSVQPNHKYTLYTYAQDNGGTLGLSLVDDGAVTTSAPATLYMVGAAVGNSSPSSDDKVMTRKNGPGGTFIYTYTGYFTNEWFKISGKIGSWDTFNSGVHYLGNELIEGSIGTCGTDSDKDNHFKVAGTYTITITYNNNNDVWTYAIGGATPDPAVPTDMYIYGNAQGWTQVNAVQKTSDTGGVFKFENYVVTNSGDKFGYFRFVTATSGGTQYGANGGNGTHLLDNGTKEKVKQTNDCFKMTPGTYNIYFDFANQQAWAEPATTPDPGVPTEMYLCSTQNDTWPIVAGTTDGSGKFTWSNITLVGVDGSGNGYFQFRTTSDAGDKNGYHPAANNTTCTLNIWVDAFESANDFNWAVPAGVAYDIILDTNNNKVRVRNHVDDPYADVPNDTYSSNAIYVDASARGWEELHAAMGTNTAEALTNWPEVTRVKVNGKMLFKFFPIDNYKSLGLSHTQTEGTLSGIDGNEKLGTFYTNKPDAPAWDIDTYKGKVMVLRETGNGASVMNYNDVVYESPNKLTYFIDASRKGWNKVYVHYNFRSGNDANILGTDRKIEATRLPGDNHNTYTFELPDNVTGVGFSESGSWSSVDTDFGSKQSGSYRMYETPNPDSGFDLHNYQGAKNLFFLNLSTTDTGDCQSTDGNGATPLAMAYNGSEPRPLQYSISFGAPVQVPTGMLNNVSWTELAANMRQPMTWNGSVYTTRVKITANAPVHFNIGNPVGADANDFNLDNGNTNGSFGAGPSEPNEITADATYQYMFNADATGRHTQTLKYTAGNVEANDYTITWDPTSHNMTFSQTATMGKADKIYLLGYNGGDQSENNNWNVASANELTKVEGEDVWYHDYSHGVLNLNFALSLSNDNGDKFTKNTLVADFTPFGESATLNKGTWYPVYTVEELQAAGFDINPNNLATGSFNDLRDNLPHMTDGAGNDNSSSRLWVEYVNGTYMVKIEDTNVLDRPWIEFEDIDATHVRVTLIPPKKKDGTNENVTMYYNYEPTATNAMGEKYVPKPTTSSKEYTGPFTIVYDATGEQTVRVYTVDNNNPDRNNYYYRNYEKPTPAVNIHYWSLARDIKPGESKIFLMSFMQNDERISPEWELRKIPGTNTYKLDNFQTMPTAYFYFRAVYNASPANHDGPMDLRYADFGPQGGASAHSLDLNSEFFGIKDMSADDLGKNNINYGEADDATYQARVFKGPKQTLSQYFINDDAATDFFIFNVGQSMMSVTFEPNNASDFTQGGKVEFALDLNEPSTLNNAPYPGVPFVAIYGSNMRPYYGNRQKLGGRHITNLRFVTDLMGDGNMNLDEDYLHRNAYTNGWAAYDENGALYVYSIQNEKDKRLYYGFSSTRGMYIDANKIINSTIQPPRHPSRFILNDAQGNSVAFTSDQVTLKYRGVENRDVLTNDGNTQKLPFGVYLARGVNLSGRYKIFTGYGGEMWPEPRYRNRYSSILSVQNALSSHYNWGMKGDKGKDPYKYSFVKSTTAMPLRGAGPYTETYDGGVRRYMDSGWQMSRDDAAGDYFQFNDRAYASKFFFYYGRGDDGVTDHDAGKQRYSDGGVDRPTFTGVDTSVGNLGRDYSWLLMDFSGNDMYLWLDQTSLKDFTVQTSVNYDYAKKALCSDDEHYNEGLGVGERQIAGYEVILYYREDATKSWKPYNGSEANSMVHPHQDYDNAQIIDFSKETSSVDDARKVGFVPSDVIKENMLDGDYQARLNVWVWVKDPATDTWSKQVSGFDDEDIPEDERGYIMSNIVSIRSLNNMPQLIGHQIIENKEIGGVDVKEYTFDIFLDASLDQYAEEYLAILNDQEAGETFLDSDFVAQLTIPNLRPDQQVFVKVYNTESDQYETGYENWKLPSEVSELLPEFKFERSTNAVANAVIEHVYENNRDLHFRITNYLPSGVTDDAEFDRSYDFTIKAKVKNAVDDNSEVTTTVPVVSPKPVFTGTAQGYKAAHINYVGIPDGKLGLVAHNDDDKPAILAIKSAAYFNAAYTLGYGDVTGDYNYLTGGGTEDVIAENTQKVNYLPYTAANENGKAVRADQVYDFDVKINYHKDDLATSVSNTGSVTYTTDDLTAPRDGLVDDYDSKHSAAEMQRFNAWLEAGDASNGGKTYGKLGYKFNRAEVPGTEKSEDYISLYDVTISKYGGVWTNYQTANVAYSLVEPNKKLNFNFDPTRASQQVHGTGAFDYGDDVNPGNLLTCTEEPLGIDVDTESNTWPYKRGVTAGESNPNHPDHKSGDRKWYTPFQTTAPEGWLGQTRFKDTHNGDDEPKAYLPWWAGCTGTHMDEIGKATGDPATSEGGRDAIYDIRHSFYTNVNHHFHGGYQGGAYLTKRELSNMLFDNVTLSGGTVTSVTPKDGSPWSGDFLKDLYNNRLYKENSSPYLVKLVDLNMFDSKEEIPHTYDLNYELDPSLVSGKSTEEYLRELYRDLGKNDNSEKSYYRLVVSVPHINHESWFTADDNCPGQNISDDGFTAADRYNLDKVLEVVKIPAADYNPLVYSFQYEYPFLKSDAYVTFETSAPSPAQKRVKKATKADINAIAANDAEKVTNVLAISRGITPMVDAVASTPGVPTSIENVEAENATGIYITYDRTDDIVIVEADVDIKNVNVVSTTGALVATKAVAKGERMVTLNISNLVSGAYIVTVDNTKSAKILK